MGRSTGNSWNTDEDALIKRLWTDGLSAAQISRRLAVDLRTHRSRNAVIGRLSRLSAVNDGRGQASAPARPPKVRDTAPKPAPTPRQKAAPKLVVPKEPTPAHAPAPIEAPTVQAFIGPAPTAKTLLELRSNRECRMPVGPDLAAGQLFCAAPTHIGSSYCPACRLALGYKPQKPYLRNGRVPLFALS